MAAGKHIRILPAVALLVLISVLSWSGHDAPVSVSIISLVADPKEFNGKTVAVTGFLALGLESTTALYLSQEDYKHRITKNGLWLELTSQMVEKSEHLDMNYVIVVGVFSAVEKGHLSMASGGITRIRTLELWSKTDQPISEKYPHRPRKRPD